MLHSRIKITCIWLMMILMFFGATASAFTDYLNIPLPETELTIEQDNEGFARFEGPDIQFRTLPGEPELPYRTVSILLPPDAELGSVEAYLDYPDTEQLDGTWEVSPAPPLIREDDEPVLIWPGDKDIVDGKDTAIYGKDVLFPKSQTGELRTGQIDVWRLVHIPVCLVRYNPLTGRLVRLNSATLLVNFISNPALWSDKDAAMAALKSTGETQVKPLVVNYNIIAPKYAPPLGSALGAPLKKAYLIITTQAIKTSSPASLQRFIADKKKQNFEVHMYDETEWGYTGISGDNAAEAIRLWLIEKNKTMDVKYTLLIGNPDPDTGDVPMKKLWAGIDGWNPPNNPDEYYPSDYYYADLTGNWDYDNDNHYGEPDDFNNKGGIDLNYEIAIGRIPHYPADSSGVLDKILNKIVDYRISKDTAWRKYALLPMKSLFETESWNTFAYNSGEQVKDRLLIPYEWGYHRVYEDHMNLDPEPESMPCTYNTAVSAWTSRPFGLVLWRTHGGPDKAQEIIRSIDTPFLDDTHPSFTFQGSCDTAWPENDNNLAYALLKNGAVSTIGSTRHSLSNAGRNGLAGMMYTYAASLIVYDRYAGNALYDMKNINNITQFWSNQASINLYGDPALSIFDGKTPDATRVEPTGRTHTFRAERGTITVNAPAGVNWKANHATSWLSIISGWSGTGPGIIEYEVNANTSGEGRRAIISVNEDGNLYAEKFYVTQQTYFEVDTANPQEYSYVSIADFNNDGYADLGVPGLDSTNVNVPYPYPVKNAAGVFVSATVNAKDGKGVSAWGDFNNDGLPDLAVCVTELEGITPPQYHTIIYRNDGPDIGNRWKLTPMTITTAMDEFCFGDLEWGDFDGDGRLDLIMSGKDPADNLYTEIFWNKGPDPVGWKFDKVTPAIPDKVRYGSLSWGDYDNDGKLDFLITGEIKVPPKTPPVYISKVYHNDGYGGSGKWNFSDMNAGLPGTRLGSAAWGDFNNDGLLDFILTGDLAVEWPESFMTEIYRNKGKDSNGNWSFTPINSGLYAAAGEHGSLNSSAAWGDYDNDGDLDLAVVGSYVETDQTAFAIKHTWIYRNDGPSGSGWIFSDINARILARNGSGVCWVDYDNDGMLDLIVPKGGYFDYNSVYHNNFPKITPTLNTIPSPPTAMGHKISGNEITFTWNDGSDSETPAEGLTYNFYVGTTPGGTEILAPLADIATGLRRVAAQGNTFKQNKWTLNNFKPGKYYWSVQSIDSMFAGSPFASERIITIDPTIKGRVVDSRGVGLSGVSIKGFPNGTVLTDANGYYSVLVPLGWSGSAMPYLMGGWYFTPSQRDYVNVTKHTIYQNYQVAGTAKLGVKYMTYRTDQTTDTIFVNLRIYNYGTNSVDLENIKAKYWYSSEWDTIKEKVEIDTAFKMPSGAYIGHVTQAQIDKLNPPLGIQDRVQITSFSNWAGVLMPNEYVEVHLRLHYTDWTYKYNQYGDYSFSNFTKFQNSFVITAYYMDSLIWGGEPF